MTYKNVLFDLDGTLTDPAEGITNSLMHAQRRLGMAVSPREKLFVFIGPPLIETFMSEWGLTRAEADRALVYYREHFGAKGLFENVPYPGIGACLAELKAAGLRLFVATSKPEPLSLRILEHFDLLQYFEAVAGSTMDERRTKKGEVIAYALSTFHLDPAETVMGGDRKHDVLGAAENGLPRIRMEQTAPAGEHSTLYLR
jgi:phosphoglycolate phosphatase